MRIKKKAPKSYHHGDLEHAILDAAILLLKKNGVSGINMREIAKMVGVTPMAIYRHFETKHHLLAALAEKGFALFTDELKKARLSCVGRPREALKAEIIAYVRFALQHRHFFETMFRFDFSPDRSFFSKMTKTADLSFQELYKALEALIPEDKIKTVNMDRISLSAWSMAHGLACLFIDKLPRGPCNTSENDFEVASAESFEIWLNGLESSWFTN